MLPEKFLNRMQGLLGADFPAFLAAMTEDAAVRGARLNRLKCDPGAFAEGSELSLTPIPYAEDCYILDSDEAVGRLPAHHAGIIYMQDPGAMASLSAVDIAEGARVIDLCAAPGGKSGQAAARIGNGGMILSNEYVPKRAKITVSNFERLGIRCGIVTSLDTSELTKLYSAFFDYVIADVPCSGEGMFRKNPEAVSEWSEENVRTCKERSRGILNNAGRLCTAGGYIIYSTCTFSLEENEQVIHEFLCDNPEFLLCEVKDCLKAKTADGISYLGAETDYLKRARRFYPHISPGEGQFVALIKRMDDKPAEITFKDASTPPDRQAAGIIAQFLKSTLAAPPRAEVRKYGENYYLISHGLPIPKNSVFSAGVLIGEIRKGILTPSHQFFTCYGGDFIRKIEPSDEEVMRYLAGEELAYDGDLTTGFCAIIYRGAPIGGGKIAGGRIKNHYPKGLRNR